MANLKNTTITDSGSLELPQGTTAQRPPTPLTGSIRYNTTLEETEFYNGDSWKNITDSFTEASGGIIVDADIGGIPYRLHYFTTVGTGSFEVTRGGEVEYLIVAGGGAGGLRLAGGGGGGGVLHGFTTVTPQTYDVIVGAGGASMTAQATNGGVGYSGSNSSVFSLTSIGGGGGGGYNGSVYVDGADGGCGGGSAGTTATSAGSGTTVQGFSGGSGDYGSNLAAYAGGAGGGAGAKGKDGKSRDTNVIGTPPNGGSGFASNISGINTFFAGGGGGHQYNNVNQYTYGGHGGGGRGAFRSTSGVAYKPSDAKPNTGGGGGGGGYYSGEGGSSGAGGSGIVIIRYRRNKQPTISSDRDILSLDAITPILPISNWLVLNLDATDPLSYKGSGTSFNDLTEFSNDGVSVNTPTFHNEYGGYFNFNGTSQYIDLVSQDDAQLAMPSSYRDMTGVSATHFAIELWVRTTQREGTANLYEGPGLVGRDNGDIYSNLLVHQAKVRWLTYNGSWKGIDSTTEIDTGQWFHIMYINKSNVGDMYINGIREVTNGDSTIATGNYFSPDSLGRGYTGSTGYFKGDIALLRFYDTSLAEEEVQQSFNMTRWRYGV